MIIEEIIHRMTRRRNGWDYCAPGCSYMITLTMADRSRNWLSQVANNGALTLTELGRVVEREWHELPANWPGVEARDFVIMPEHFHGIIAIRERQNHPLGQIVGSFKARTTSLANKLASTMTPASRGGREPPGIVPASLLAGSSLWSPGLTDSILWSRERHSRAAAYIADNPRRLAERRANPRLFTVRRDFAVPLPLGDGGSDVVAHFSAIGNDGLLKRLDFHQVQCSRRFFEYSRDKYGKPLKNAPPAVETAEFRARLEDALASAEDGAVLVNPCISHGEREIARCAFVEGAEMIVLKNQGFSPYFKPEGALFERCSAGGMLMLAPSAWPHTTGKKPMTREDACVLNRIAQAIARDGAVEIDYKGRTPALVDEDARVAVMSGVPRPV